MGGGLVLASPEDLTARRENFQNVVAGLDLDKFADHHPPPSSDLPLPTKTKVVVVTGIKKNSEFELRVRRG